jgi:hypothetical protein
MINTAAVMPLGMIEADLVRQDLNGTRSLAAVQQLLIETWPEHFKKEPQRVRKSQIAGREPADVRRRSRQ